MPPKKRSGDGEEAPKAAKRAASGKAVASGSALASLEAPPLVEAASSSDAAPTSLASAKIGFLGAGMMASAMINGFLSKGLTVASNIIASDTSSDLLKKHGSTGVKVTQQNTQVAEFADIIVIAVKVSWML